MPFTSGGTNSRLTLPRPLRKLMLSTEKGFSSVVGQTNYPIKLFEKCYTLFQDLSVLRLCLLECRDPLITSRNGDLHFPSHNCFTTSAGTR